MPVEKTPEQLELESIVEQAYATIKSAERFADKNNLSFDFAIASGELRATYYGKKAVEAIKEDFGLETDEEALDYRNDSEDFLNGWHSSYFNY